MKKYFVCTDIHGFYDEFISALNEAGFDIDNSEHIIISCGDALDRGNQPREMLQFLNKMYRDGRAILIKGNHEELMDTMIWNGKPNIYDIQNDTFGSVQKMFKHINKYDGDALIGAMMYDNEWCNYWKSLIDYYETDHYIFTHASIPPDKNWRNGDWKKARWRNGYAMRTYNETGKTLVVGHWHCSAANAKEYPDKYKEFPELNDKEYVKQCFAPFISDDLIMFDACTAYSGLVNILVFNENEM